MHVLVSGEGREPQKTVVCEGREPGQMLHVQFVQFSEVGEVTQDKVVMRFYVDIRGMGEQTGVLGDV